MELSTAEKFIFIVQHPKKAGTRIYEQNKNAGLLGAIISDLVISGNIDLVNNRVKVLNSKTDLSDGHAHMLLQMVEKKKEKKIKFWISQNMNRTRKFRYPLQDDLQKKNLVHIDEKKFMFVPYRNVYLVDRPKQLQLIEQIRNLILHGKEFNNEMGALLGVAYGSKLHRILGIDNKQKREIRKRLKEIICGDVISKSIDAVIRETNAAVAGAVAASSASAAASAGS